MKKTVLLMLATFAVSMLMAATIVGKSKPFAVNTMIGDFKIMDVKSDYCSGAYGKSSKQTFLSGVKCEIEFTVSTTPFYDVDYITVNGEIYNYPKFKFDVGKLGSGGAMKVVAVSKDGEKTEPFRVNLDLAKPHDTMVAPKVSARGSGEVTYASLYSGLKVVDSDRFFKLASGKQKSPYRENPVLFAFEGHTGVRMQSEYSSRTRICELAGSAKLVNKPVGWAANVAYNEALECLAQRDKRVKLLDIEITGSQKWRWNSTLSRYDDYSKHDLGLKFPLKHNFKTKDFGPGLFWQIGMRGALEVKGVQYTGNEWRFEYAGDPEAYASLGVGVPDVLASTVKLSGTLSFEGGAPARPYYIDKIELRAKLSGDVEHLWDNAAGENHTEWIGWEWLLGKWDFRDNIVAHGSAMPSGGAKKSLSFAGSQRGAEVLTTGVGASSRFVPDIATTGNDDIIAYLESAPGRTGMNRTCLTYKIGREDDWSSPEVVWDDGTVDGVASIGMSCNGQVVVAWSNGRDVLGNDVTLVDTLKNFEMAVAVRDPISGNWDVKNLTNDSSYNHMPRVTIPVVGNEYLVFWLSTEIKDAGDEFVKPSCLMCARHVGDGTWATTEIARSTSLPILSYDVTCDGDGRFELLWSECDYDAGIQRTHYVRETGAPGATGFGTISTSVLGEKDLGVMPRFVDEKCGSKIVWIED